MKTSYLFFVLCLILSLALSIVGVSGQTSGASNISSVTSPTNTTLNAVFVVNNQTATTNDLTKLDAWAVGNSGTIVRWNGTVWSMVNSSTTANLNGVFFVNSTYGWAVGGNLSSGVILNYNGTWRNWQSVVNTSGGNASINAPLYAITGDSNGTTGWAVGANGTVFGWNSTTCFAVSSGSNVTLRGVGMIHNSNEAWAVGDNGTILHFSNSTNTWSNMTSGTNSTLYAIEMINGTMGWAGGGNNAGNGTMLNLNGTSWSTYNRFNFGANGSITPNLNATVYSISAGNASSAWAVGDNSTVMYFNGTTWSCNANVASGVLRSVSMVHGAGINQAWAVGDSGKILAFNGTIWIPEIPSVVIPLLLGIGLLVALSGKIRLFKRPLFQT
jgi:photosystem II stability/assembly factor-like uncharacterized protein